MRLLWGMEKATVTSRNIVFQEEDQAGCIENMRMSALSAGPSVA
jgi:hypothetical protein